MIETAEVKLKKIQLESSVEKEQLKVNNAQSTSIAEVYLEPIRTSTMKLFCENS